MPTQCSDADEFMDQLDEIVILIVYDSDDRPCSLHRLQISALPAAAVYDWMSGNGQRVYRMDLQHE